MEKDESKLEDLKEKYEVLKKKHNLPSFRELNEDFSIEKAAEAETDIPIREIRKLIADKLAGYMRLLEAFINPVNSPIFVFSIIKTFGIEERKNISEIYKKLAKNEVELILVDTEFSEEKEAEFIKESYKLWQEIKRDLLGILNIIKKNWDSKFEVENKGYFG